MEKRLIHNAIRTPDGTILVSYHRHDYKSYVDANNEIYVIDGGLEYVRTSVNSVPAESLAIYDDAPFEVIREYLHRGGRGEDVKQELKYVALKDINDDWLENLIKYEEERRPNNIYLKFYKQEKEWRILMK